MQVSAVAASFAGEHESPPSVTRPAPCLNQPLTAADRALLAQLAPHNDFLRLLLHMGIEQSSILAWAATLNGVSMAEAWEACPQGDWSIHIAAKLQTEARDLARGAVAAARCALPVGAAHPRLQVLIGQVEGLIDGSPDYGQGDADSLLRELAAVDVYDLPTPIERAIYGAGEAWASTPDPRQTRAYASDAAWEAAHHLALMGGAPVDEDGDVGWSASAAIDAQSRVATAVRSALTWQCVVGSLGRMLTWVEQQAEQAARRAA